MKSKFGRRHRAHTRLLAVMIAISVSWAFASCRSLDESEGGKFDVKIGYYPGALVSLPALVASERGFYEKHGLNAELVSVPDGPAMTSGLASGSLDFVNNSYDNLAVAVDKQLSVKAVAGNTVRVPFKLLVRQGVDMPHADQGYPDVVADLVGLKWGVIALGVSLQYLDETLLTSAGHAKDDVTFLAVGLGDSARAALDNATVDTYIATEPLPAIAAATGDADVAVDLAAGEGPEELANLDYNGWWASDSTVESDPDVVERFVKAHQDAYCWYTNPANFDDLLTILKEAVPVPALNDAQYAAMVKASLPTFGVTIQDESLATWQDLLVENGVLDKTRDRDDLVAPDAPTTFGCPK